MQKICDEPKQSFVCNSIKDRAATFLFQSAAAQRLRPLRDRLSPDGWSNMYSAAVADASSSQKQQWWWY